MPSIAVPHDFFLSERNTAYADWHGAFWRELISNSVDAGATRLHVRTRFTPDGGFLIDFADNGTGMGRQTIETVYMRLGASTKRDEAGIGGFGRARILTCFSQRAYRIRTANLVVTGEGGDYEIRETDSSVKGCAISVTADPDEARRLTRALTMVLQQSRLHVEMTADLVPDSPRGEVLFTPEERLRWSDGGRFRGWTRPGTHIRTLTDETGTWADIHVSRGDKALHETSIIRVNGMAMHDDHLAARAQVIVELNPHRAREILTSARDSIRAPWRHELQKLYAEVASEAHTALRNKTREKRTVLIPSRGGGAGQPPPRAPSTASTPPAQVVPEEGRRNDDRARETVNACNDAPSQTPRRVGDPLIDRLISIRDEIPGPRLDVGIHIDSPTPAQRAAVKRFLPETWSAPGGGGRNAELLHAAWSGACRHALDALVKVRPCAFRDSDRWVTGFVFDAQMRACHAAVGAVRHGLLLNPVDDGGRMIFRLKSREDLRRLSALACHEVAHCVHSWHDESFANLLTTLQYETSEKGFWAAIRDEMEATRDWASARDAAWRRANAQLVDMGLGEADAIETLETRIRAVCAEEGPSP